MSHSEHPTSALTAVSDATRLRDRVAAVGPAVAAQECWGAYGPRAVEMLLDIYDRDRRGGLPKPSLGTSYIDETAAVHETAKVWHFAVVQARAVIGEHCNIWSHARILPDVVLGSDVSIGGGTEIGKGSTIGDGSRIGANCFFPPNSRIGQRVFVGPSVSCADDRHPFVHELNDPAYVAQPPIIEDSATIGLGAVLLPGVRIGHGAVVAAGAIVTKDVPPHGTVRCEPARPFAMSEGARQMFPIRKPA